MNPQEPARVVSLAEQRNKHLVSRRHERALAKQIARERAARFLGWFVIGFLFATLVALAVL